MYHYRTCGLKNIYLSNGYTIKDSPDGKTISIHNIESLHAALSQNLIHREFPLTCNEFRFLRIELDLSQKALGKLMGKSDQMVAKWEKGESPIPILADKAIRDLYMESIGESPISGLLTKLAELDNEFAEFEINAAVTNSGWIIQAA